MTLGKDILLKETFMEEKELKTQAGGTISEFQQKISKEVWHSTYRWETETTVDELWHRQAKAIAAPERPQIKQMIEEYFYNILKGFKYVPGGRIQSNAGLALKGTTLTNCFVGGFTGENQDSIDGIYKALGEQAKTLKSEGGYGFCIDVLRPDGAYIEGIANYSPGPMEFAKLWDLSSGVVTSGVTDKKNIKKKKGKGKIRKGAQMITMSCWHPSIKKYIVAKQIPGNMTKFNMSVLIKNKFMDAVKNDLDWNLVFPDTKHESYDKLWDGDLDKWIAINGENSVIIYETIKARELWDLIMISTYNRNEPGVIFVDRINELNNLWYCEFINATNPCGEQPLPIHGNCNLGSINLTQYIKNDNWDYDSLKKDIPYMVRFQDNVNDVSLYPLEGQKEQAKLKRRVGIGYLGYGSALYMLKVPYGSTKALKMTDELCEFVTNEIYKASASLAEEKGCFPAYNKEKYLRSKFIRQALSKETQQIIASHGMRNSHLTMIAPTGNTGIEANNVSGGLEPVISVSYIRTRIVDELPDGLFLPENISWAEKTFTSKTEWKWTKEGDESILIVEFNNEVYKFDRNRGLVKEEEVKDYAVLNMSDFDPNADYVKTIYNLGVKEHIDTMNVFAKYVDAGISKTINLPNDYPFEDFKNIYMDAFDSGYIKGFTTYRWGTMTSVISTESTKAQEDEFKINHAPKRPKSMDADVFKTTVQGEKWIVFVGKMNDKPYEVFAGKVDLVDIPNSIKTGKLSKAGNGKYQFEYDGDVLVSDISKIFQNDINDNITRLTSTALRHGAEVKFIVEQLNKAQGIVTSFSKSLARALKHYIPDGEKSTVKCQECGSSNVIFQEGCNKCVDCGSSKCG